MNGIKILHAADLHMDSPFEGLPEGKAARRRKEQRELLARIAELAVRERVQLVLLPGDLLDSDSAFTETAEELIKALGSIAAPVFISPGNHDFYTERSPYARLAFPENVYIFRKNELECVELPELGVRVWGAAFTDKYSRGLLEGFSVQKLAGTTDILCLHGEVGRESQYCPISEAQLAASGFDYAALGHIHQGSGLRKAGNTYYAWPGCPEGRGFDECGEKFVYIAGLLDGECRIKQVNTAARRYEIVYSELDGADAVAAIRSCLPGNTKNDIYRIILRGETAEAPDMTALRECFEPEFFSLQLRDETTLRRDIWERAGEDSLRGQFLQRLRDAYNAANESAEKEKIIQAARWGLAALDKREEVVRHDDQ